MTFFLSILVVALGVACLVLLLRQPKPTGPSAAEIRAEAQLEAQTKFNEWRSAEQAAIREAAEAQLEQSRQLITKQLTAQLEADKKVWMVKEEKRIRADAVQRSASVRAGHMTEHFAPYLPAFDYNPKDARFLGAPTDLIVFNGLDDGDLQEIVFVEVKMNTSTMNQRERQVRAAIEDGRVRFQEMRIQVPVQA